jgi:hypothetical protein
MRLLHIFVLMMTGCGGGDSDAPSMPWPTVWYASPKGVVLGFVGPWPAHTPGSFPSDPDFLSRSAAGAELDLTIEAGAAAHGVDPAYAKSLAYVIVDDYVFATAYSVTGYAAGMTDSKNYVMLALWSRYEGDAPAPGSPPWTQRPPGMNGYSVWRWGGLPYYPAMAHELCHVYNPSAPCGH